MKRQWTRDELVDHWTLAPNELELLANKTGATRLGFAVLLKAFRVEGRFPRQKHDVPGVVIVHVANQVNVAADLYPRYEWSGRTIEYHRAQIREFLGFREATVQDGAELVTWLADRVLPQEPREDHVHEALFERCRALRIEPPSAGRIDRLVRSAFHSFEERWCAGKLRYCWSPTRYADGATSRGNAGVLEVSALVFDLDRVPPDPERLAGVYWLGHTTYRHTPTAPRWRVVIPLATPVPAAQWRDVWRRARAALCPEADPSCKDRSRQYYPPSHSGGVTAKATCHEGALLDPSTLPALPAEPVRPELRRSPSAKVLWRTTDDDRRRGE